MEKDIRPGSRRPWAADRIFLLKFERVFVVLSLFNGANQEICLHILLSGQNRFYPPLHDFRREPNRAGSPVRRGGEVDYFMLRIGTLDVFEDRLFNFISHGVTLNN
jgi:hypothetical protein